MYNTIKRALTPTWKWSAEDKRMIFKVVTSPERDSMFDILGMDRIRESYFRDGETSPQERFAFISKSFASNEAHAQRLYDYSSKHWLSYSSPLFAFGRTKHGQPISCFLSWIDDSASGLLDASSEVKSLSMAGGGVGIGFGIRSKDEKSTGVMPHLKAYDADSIAYKQGTTRRGSFAAYLDISHPDITQFMDIRKVTGDPNQRCLNMNHAINIPDAFMELVEASMYDANVDDSWPLVDPHSNEVREVVSARELWMKIIDYRMGPGRGQPMLHFIDTSNRLTGEWLKKKSLWTRMSNLCTEITVPSNKDRTAVCCLSSLNVEYFDDWKDHPTFISDVMEMLDNVIEYFTHNAPHSMRRAIYSAKMGRDVGLGQLGLHAYFQKNGIAFESVMAKIANKKIASHIFDQVNAANHRLAKERGECPDCKGYGRRFSHSMAIAPNATSSILMGNTSPSVEPFSANAYRQDTMSGAFLNKNRHLDKLMRTKYEYDDNKMQEFWLDVVSNDGSVQHRDDMDEHDKMVYRTWKEMDQRWIIDLASDRQKKLDQSQSINLAFKPTADIKYVHAVHFMAWKMDLKTLYYCRTDKIRKADKVSQAVERKIIESIDLQQVAEGNTCIACEG